MKIPNAEHAIVEIRKLRTYCLNTQHDEGQHKAHQFYVTLGISLADAEELREVLLQAVKSHDAALGDFDEHGQRYTVDFSLDWRGRQACIRSAWIIEAHSDAPRLITAYPL